MTGTALGGDVVGLCTYCGRTAARTCAGCGLPICEAHAAPEMPMFCLQCARGRSHMSAVELPDQERARDFAHDLGNAEG